MTDQVEPSKLKNFKINYTYNGKAQSGKEDDEEKDRKKEKESVSFLKEGPSSWTGPL